MLAILNTLVPTFTFITCTILFTLRPCLSQVELSNSQPRCQVVQSSICSMMSSNTYIYETMHPFKNNFGHASHEEATHDLYRYAYILKQESPCAKYLELFLCSLYIPFCTIQASDDRQDAMSLSPCREICERAKSECQNEKILDLDRKEYDCKQFKPFKVSPVCFHNNNTEFRASKSTDGIELPPPATDCGKLFDCKIKKFKPGENGKIPGSICLDDSLVCDGQPQCRGSVNPEEDGLDEKNCKGAYNDTKLLLESMVCNENEFLCDDRCQSSSIRCDTRRDCSMGEDEKDCPSPESWILSGAIVIIIVTLILIFVSCPMRGSSKKPLRPPSLAGSLMSELSREPVDTNPVPRIKLLTPNVGAESSLNFDQIHEPTGRLSETPAEIERITYGGFSSDPSLYSEYVYRSNLTSNLSSMLPSSVATNSRLSPTATLVPQPFSPVDNDLSLATPKVDQIWPEHPASPDVPNAPPPSIDLDYCEYAKEDVSLNDCSANGSSNNESATNDMISSYFATYVNLTSSGS